VNYFDKLDFSCLPLFGCGGSAVVVAAEGVADAVVEIVDEVADFGDVAEVVDFVVELASVVGFAAIWSTSGQCYLERKNICRYSSGLYKTRLGTT